MVTDHKKIHAAASASFCVRFSFGMAMLCGALLGGTAVHAAGPDGDQQREQHQPSRHDDSHAQAQQMREVSREVQHDSRFQPQPQPQNPPQAQQRQYDPRSFEARAEEQRRAMQDSNRNAEVSRRVGRMTPDERRDLRRQINEAGQDIYANPPRR
jgi:hypothetical protein